MVVYDSLSTNIAGCDSLAVTLDLNHIQIPILLPLIVTSCNPYLWNGQTYLVSGIYDSLFC